MQTGCCLCYTMLCDVFIMLTVFDKKFAQKPICNKLKLHIIWVSWTTAPCLRIILIYLNIFTQTICKKQTHANKFLCNAITMFCDCCCCRLLRLFELNQLYIFHLHLSLVITINVMRANRFRGHLNWFRWTDRYIYEWKKMKIHFDFIHISFVGNARAEIMIFQKRSSICCSSFNSKWLRCFPK